MPRPDHSSYAIGPGGALLSSGSRGLVLHDLEAARDLRAFRVERAEDFAGPIAFSVDGSSIAAARDRQVSIFQRDRTEPVATMLLEQHPTELAFSLDEASLIALFAGDAPGVVVLDARNGSVRSSHRFAPGEKPIRLYPSFVVVWHPDGATPEQVPVAVLDFDGAPRGRWSVPRTGSIAFSPDGERAAILEGTSFRVVEASPTGAPGKLLWAHDLGPEGKESVRPIRFTSDGKRLIAGVRRGREVAVTVFLSSTGEVDRTASCPNFSDPLFAPDGRWAVLFDWDGVRTCHLEARPRAEASRSQKGRLEGLRAQPGVVYSWLVGPNLDPSQLVAFDAKTGAPTPAEVEKRASPLTVASNGRRAVEPTRDCLVVHERVETEAGARSWNEGRCLRSPGPIEGDPLISADGRWAIVEASHGVIELWSLDEGSIVRTFAGEESWDVVAFSADGRWAIAGTRTSLVAFSRDAGKSRWSYEAEPRTEIVAVAAAPDQDEVAVALDSGEVLLIDGAGKPERLVDLGASVDRALALLYTTEGTLVVATARGAVLAFRR